VRALPALGKLSYEGISVLPNGVTYYQDENRPSGTDTGGGYFKFIPTTLWTPGSPAITDLANSPLAAGRVFGLRLGRNNGNTDIGAGNHTGRGVWTEIVSGQVIGATTVSRSNLRVAATAMKLTTGYRPEDQDLDKGALAKGNVRFCGTNTGQDSTATLPNGANNFGETFCITDGTVADAAFINTVAQTVGGIAYTVNSGAGTTIPEYQTLVEHFLDFAMPDNIAYQPGRGNWLINEDGDGATYSPARNNDIWDCLDDGLDKDGLADACVKVMTINDLTAETTGGVFNYNGTEYYVSIQHNKTGHGLIVKVSGWKAGRDEEDESNDD
jgi:secreted PhoX family phosphatase